MLLMSGVGRRVACVLVGLVSFAFLFAGSPTGYAAPDPNDIPSPGSDSATSAADGRPPAGAMVFSLTDMGTPAPLTFYGDQGTAELTFPVPRGLVPLTLNATVELPVNVRSSAISVMQQERTIARIPLPTNDQAPVVIPLSGVSIADNSVTVTLRTNLVPVEGYCLDPTNPLRLTNAAVTFGGDEQPAATVAEFLPPILRKLTIAIPPNPERAESDAAVRLAAAVTARYGQQPTKVVVVASAPPPPPAGPFERQIIIQQGTDVGVALQPLPGALPNLRISGPENELTNQARLLSSDLNRLALSSKAVVGPLRTAPQLPGDVTTLRRLGQPVVSAVALAPQVAIGIDQTRIGRPTQNVRVHLTGSYTPLPAGVSARLVAIVGGETIDTWQVDDRGLIDRWIDVPDRLLQRYTTVGISLNVAGPTGRCGEFQPLTLTIDGDSVVESSAAVPPTPAGLQSLPQALMPRTLIGIGPGAFADTVRATAIAVALQRLSALPIDTEVTGIDEALAGKLPAVIISADGWDKPEVPLPIRADQGRLNVTGMSTDGKPDTLTLDPELRYGALQAFYDGRRSLLVATSNGAPDQLDALLSWVSADPRRFSKLDGVALVGAPGQQPVVVGPQSGVAASTSAPGSRIGWWVAGAVTAVAVGAAAFALLRRNRRRAGGTDDG
ncbi:MAG: hypothetical protein QG597_3958 [Actinomycetota bacterium]|nr:hypothetical protein [Actinomycetota bacterium]